MSIDMHATLVWYVCFYIIFVPWTKFSSSMTSTSMKIITAALIGACLLYFSVLVCFFQAHRESKITCLIEVGANGVLVGGAAALCGGVYWLSTLRKKR